jgi:hypothetical protein
MVRGTAPRAVPRLPSLGLRAATGRRPKSRFGKGGSRVAAAAGGDDGDQRVYLGVRSGVAAVGGDNGGGGARRGSSLTSPRSDALGDDRKLHTHAPLTQIQALVDGSWAATRGKARLRGECTTGGMVRVRRRGGRDGDNHWGGGSSGGDGGNPRWVATRVTSIIVPRFVPTLELY